MHKLIGHTLPIRRYRFTLQAEQEIRWPDYAGSMLRGSFGHGLRSVSCVTKQKSCDGCPLYQGCQYPALFNPAPPPALEPRFADMPAPYIFRVGIERGYRLQPGDTVQFEMTLFGTAIHQISTIILAWQRACYNGLGAGKGRARIIQTDVYQPDTTGISLAGGHWQSIYTADQPVISPHDLPLTIPELPAAEDLQIRLKTPTRIQHRGRFLNSHTLSSQYFFQALVRKVQLYAKAYMAIDLQPPEHWPDMIRFDKKLTVHQWQRYSNRQKQAMKMDGLIGTINISHLPQEWLYWLWLGQLTHLGKNTTFGLGQYHIQALSVQGLSAAQTDDLTGALSHA